MKQDRGGWWRCDIARADLTPLLARSDRAGLLNLAVFLIPLATTGVTAVWMQGTVWSLLAFWAYGSIYGFCNSLLHETHHATPFRSRWLNERVHMLAGLMAFRNPIYDRSIHTQHHNQTSRTGRDPELAHPAPVNPWKLALDLFWLRAAVGNPALLVRQAFGGENQTALDAIPKSERSKVRTTARAMLSVYAALILVAIAFQTWLPLMLTYFAHIYGGLIPRAYSLTQHVGLDQDQDDFRLTTRTCLYNPIISKWYWNMQYHIEHHMYPLVPFHQLPALHETVKHEMPTPVPGVIAAWRDIFGCIRTQMREPGFVIRPHLPGE